MARIIVTDGEQRAALAAVRSLGQARHAIMVGATDPKSLAGSSRYASETAVLTNPLDDPIAFAREVAALSERWSADVLLPITDASLVAVLSNRSLFTSTRVPFPDLATVRKAADKSLLMTTAPKAGINVPAQVVLSSLGEDVNPTDVSFPLVIKPSRSVVDSGGGQIKLGVLHAADASQLTVKLATLPAEGYPVMLQQRIVGPGIGVFLLVWDGHVRALFSHRRLREKPPAGGVSVYRESIAADPNLVECSRKLLELIGWQGVAMIEYKVDAATGVPYLMEINGRFWGSLQLAVDAGVDFPDMLVRLALGQRVDPRTTYRTGIRSRWWWGDVDQLISRLRRSPAQISLPPGHPGRLAALAEFGRLWWPGDRNEILRWNDPAPFIRETINWFKGR